MTCCRMYNPITEKRGVGCMTDFVARVLNQTTIDQSVHNRMLVPVYAPTWEVLTIKLTPTPRSTVSRPAQAIKPLVPSW